MSLCSLLSFFRLYTDTNILSWCVISDDGKVFSWGYGGHGQLGHSFTQNQKVPMVIEALADEFVTHIACGGSTSAAVTGKRSYIILDIVIVIVRS